MFKDLLVFWNADLWQKSTTRHKINYLPSVWIQYENKLLPKLMDSSENVSDPWSISWKIYISTKRCLPHTDIFQRMVMLRNKFKCHERNMRRNLLWDRLTTIHKKINNKKFQSPLNGVELILIFFKDWLCLETNSSVKRGTSADIYFEID